ncbi:hypothetical protein BCR36DRAFT_1542 [Piromyces finnis]|uniref:Uncharacterized protein n=1 Tax=Piromyces finnis TaxID=1754191 RepID=A0A1Y1VN11_9FUNG|nr:hypothetical protein BCR36DRAFT_1542 [Piromyces finnis]|eukprot:ORX60814.1 hypothetical protein BCR36DRAFT_1542 [Piromyces finnis]
MYLRRSTRKRNKPDLYYPGFSYQSSNKFPHIKSKQDNINYSENSRYIPENNRDKSRNDNSYNENRNNNPFSNTRKRKNTNYDYDEGERDRDRRHKYSNYLTRYDSNSSTHSRHSLRMKSFMKPLSNSPYSSTHFSNYTSSPASTISANSNSSIYYPIKRKRVYYSPSDHLHHHTLKNYYPSYSNYSSRSSKVRLKLYNIHLKLFIFY